MKRIVSLILALCLLPAISAPKAAAAGPFADIPDGETRQAAELLFQLGIVSGTGAATYSPGQLFDRAALAVIGTRLSGLFDVSTYGGTVRFPDVRASHWAHRWINAANALDIMKGSTDGRFYPEDPMLYGQLVTVLMKLLGYTDGDVGLNWPYSYIAKSEALGIGKGMTFTAGQRLTRGQAARLIYDFLFTELKDGGVYIERAFGTSEEEVLLMFDVAGGKTFIGKDYVYHGVLDPSLQYRYANIFADKDGKVLSITIDDSVTYRQGSVQTARERGLELTDGVFLPVAAGAVVFDWEGVSSAYTPHAFLEDEAVRLATRDGTVLYILRDSYEHQIGAKYVDTILLRLRTSGSNTYIVAEDGTTTYRVKGEIDPALRGRIGRLMTDRDDLAIRFTVSEDYTYQNATVAETWHNGFYDDKGEFVAVPAGTVVWSDTKKENYDDLWLDHIRPGEGFLMAYDDAGILQYLYRAAERGSGEYRLAVLEKQPEKGRDPLADAFGGKAAGAALFKNGFPATLDMLERWDVLMFYESAGVAEASSIRVSGFYSNPRPNPLSPSEVTLFGRKFALLPEAAARIRDYSSSLRWVFLLSADGRVADIRSTGEADTTISLAGKDGVLVGSSSLELKGVLTGVSLMTGRLGRFRGSADSGILFAPIETQNAGKDALDLTAQKLGSAPLAPWCVFYDQVGGVGRAVRVSLSDIPVNRVPAGQILYAETSLSGYVTAVVLGDVTGDAYSYGFVYNEERDVPISSPLGSGLGGSYRKPMMGVSPESSIHKVTEWLISDNAAPPRYGTVAGVAPGYTLGGDTGVVAGVVTCVKHEGLTRYDFNGSRSVKINGKDVPLAADTVLVPVSGEPIMTIADARIYCRTFEVYTDPGGYRVRFIIGAP